MLRKSIFRFQAFRENIEKNINRPIKQATTAWNNDSRYGKKEVKKGDPDPIIMRVLRNADSFSPKVLKARVISDTGKVGFFLVSVTIVYYFASPTFERQKQETSGLGTMIIEDASVMPEQSPQWWDNEWRKGAVGWRSGESKEGFHEANFKFVKEVTGRDLLNVPLVPLTHVERSSTKAYYRKGMRKALVPLCGDSPIVRVLAEHGYFVHAIDCSELAMQSLSKYLKYFLKKDDTWNVKLHWADFFDPNLWAVAPTGLSKEQKDLREAENVLRVKETLASETSTDSGVLVMPNIEDGLKGEKFDFIYDRQALSTFHHSHRANYAYLLKKALADDGVIFIEGIFRTGRVKGNKVRGPPYGLSENQIRELFPEEEGFFVKCDTSVPDNLFSLDKANKILGTIPKDLYATAFPCVVWKENVQRN